MALSERFIDALQYAARLHADQQRKISQAPYVAHLLGVCAAVLACGGDEDEAIAALLHDAVEDQGGAARREDIANRFGTRVAEIVDGCSDSDVQPKPPWSDRKKLHVAHVAGASRSVRLVLTADKLDNGRALLREYRAHGESIWQHFNGRREGTLWYYRTMAEALFDAESNPMTEELQRLVAEIDQTTAL